MVAWRRLGWWVALLISLPAAEARGAEPPPTLIPPPPPPPPPPPATPGPAPVVPVTFRTTEEGAALSVRGVGLPTSAGFCPTQCTLSVTPGNYMVTASSGGSKSATLNVDVRGPSEVVVSPGNPFVRGLGLAFIIVGGTLALGGFTTFYFDTSLKLQEQRHPDDPNYAYSSPDWVVPVEILGALGLALAVPGVVMFVTTGPSVKVLPGKTAGRPSRFALTPSIGVTGGGLRVRWAF